MLLSFLCFAIISAASFVETDCEPICKQSSVKYDICLEKCKYQAKHSPENGYIRDGMLVTCSPDTFLPSRGTDAQYIYKDDKIRYLESKTLLNQYYPNPTTAQQINCHEVQEGSVMGPGFVQCNQGTFPNAQGDGPGYTYKVDFNDEKKLLYIESFTEMENHIFQTQKLIPIDCKAAGYTFGGIKE